MKNFQACAVLVIILFALAVFAPGREILEAGRITHRHVQPTSGLIMLKIGWLGPLQLSIAWYANLPLLLCLSRMLRNRTPGFPLARVTACLATTALLPIAAYSGQDGWHLGWLRGPAVWLWLAAFGVTFACALHLHARNNSPLEVPVEPGPI